MRQSMDWRGGAVKASSGRVGRVESRFGMARNGRAVGARRAGERYGVFGMARPGRAVTAWETINKSERRQYASIYQQVFISQRL